MSALAPTAPIITTALAPVTTTTILAPAAPTTTTLAPAAPPTTTTPLVAPAAPTTTTLAPAAPTPYPPLKSKLYTCLLPSVIIFTQFFGDFEVAVFMINLFVL